MIRITRKSELCSLVQNDTGEGVKNCSTTISNLTLSQDE